MEFFLEDLLSTSSRKRLKDSSFGLPDERKYPLTDAKHVKSAIAYFRYCPEDKKISLANKILIAAKKYKVNISPESEVYKLVHEGFYIDEFSEDQPVVLTEAPEDNRPDFDDIEEDDPNTPPSFDDIDDSEVVAATGGQDDMDQEGAEGNEPPALDPEEGTDNPPSFDDEDDGGEDQQDGPPDFTEDDTEDGQEPPNFDDSDPDDNNSNVRPDDGETNDGDPEGGGSDIGDNAPDFSDADDGGAGDGSDEDATGDDGADAADTQPTNPGVGGIAPELQELQNSAFSKLTAEQIKVKTANIKQSYIDLFNDIVEFIERLSTVNRSSENLETINYISNTLSGLKVMIKDSLTDSFNTRSLVENQIVLQRFIATYSMAVKMLEKISTKKQKK